MNLIKRDGALTFESVSVTESGELMPVEVRAKIINYQGEEAVLTFSRDLTEQRAKEGAMINKLEVLHKHAINLSKLYSIESIAEYSLDVIEELLGRGKVSIGVVDGDQLRFLFSRDFPTEKPLSLSLEGEGITVRAVRTGETQLVDDTRRDPDYIPFSQYSNCLSELDVPIKFNGKVVAVINLNISEANAFTEQERKIVEILSEHISSAIARLQLLQNAKKSD